MRRHPTLLLLVLPLILSGCSRDEADERVRDEVGLQPFEGCRALEAYIKAEAIREMNAALDEVLEGGGFGPVRTLAPAAAPAPSPASGAAQDYTTTNTREKGVDEADVVKNDGARLFLFHGGALVALSAWPAESTHVLWTLPVEGDPLEMHYDGTRVVVVSNLSPLLPVDLLPRMGYPALLSRFKLTLVDVSGSGPRVLREDWRDGRYVSSRRIGSRLHVVSSGLKQPTLQLYPDEWPQSEAAWRLAVERLRLANLERIAATPLEAWLPAHQERLEGGALHTAALSCSTVNAVDAPVRLGLTTVSSFTLDRPSVREEVSLLHDAEQVYASTRSLYLSASHRWLHSWRAPSPAHTYLHRFDLAGGRVRPVGSGRVEGAILNSFSIDEEGEYLRLAVTRTVSEGRFQARTENDVVVLSLGGGRLSQAGELRGLAPGESIFSARFEGTRGYLVTFQRIDPVFTLDFSDPRQPRLMGELEIPGFSTYLHPLDDGHLLAIGRGDGGNGWFPGALALKVFDVRDLAHPLLRHEALVGGSAASSAASWDHRAFNYFPSRALLAIPFSDWSVGARGYRSSLELFRVTAEGGIAGAGSIDHADLMGTAGGRGWTPYVYRGVMLDDFVYSISSGGVKVSPMAAPDRPVAVVELGGVR